MLMQSRYKEKMRELMMERNKINEALKRQGKPPLSEASESEAEEGEEVDVGEEEPIDGESINSSEGDSHSDHSPYSSDGEDYDPKEEERGRHTDMYISQVLILLANRKRLRQEREDEELTTESSETDKHKKSKRTPKKKQLEEEGQKKLRSFVLTDIGKDDCIDIY